MPASYPTTVKSFNTKVNLTDVVDASHPNSVQDEVVAIETILGISPNLSTTPNPATGFTATSTSFATLAARLANIENGIVGDNHSQYLKFGLFTAKGQIIGATGNGAAAALAAGTDGFALVADATTATGLKWAARAPATAVDKVLIDAKGDLIVGSADDTVVRLPVGANGTVLVADSAQTSGVKWGAATKTVRIPHTFTISGEVRVAAGDDYYVPPFFVPVPTGQTVTVAAAWYRINSGTSVVFAIAKNGTNITGLTSLVASPTAGGNPASGGNTCADGDAIALVVSSVAGTPKNLSVTLYLDYTV